ncbi:hypothetical protein ScPMuIL_013116 [Solemya velum]
MYGGGEQRRGGGRRYGHSDDPEAEQYRKIFVGGLSYETDEDSLKRHFEQWGEIVDCVVMRNPETKRSRGFGFITYAQAHMVDDAQANRPHKIDGREVESKRAMPRDESGQSESQQSVKKMFIGGIKDDINDQNIREYFQQYGAVESVDLIKDKATGKNRGFCFVQFNDHDIVDKCVLKKYHEINGKKVEVKKALNKNEQGGGGGGRGRCGARGGGGSFGGRGGYGGGGGGGGYGGGGYGGGSGWNQGGGGGYGDGYGGYGGGQGGGWNQQSYGSGYGDSYGGGAMKGGGGYTQRGQGPYGGSYGSGGGYGGGYRQ